MTKFFSVFNRQNLLFLNAILCMCYPLCYIMLILLPFGEEALNKSFFTSGVVALNVMFLFILILNLNTITIVYRALTEPPKYIRIVYKITFSVWLAYVLMAIFRTFYDPDFLFRFYHHIRHSFRTLGVAMSVICAVFGIGLSLLLREYYLKEKMKHLLYFIIPATLQFAFKIMLPFLFTLQAWIVFSGCQLLLYYSIVHSKRRAKNLTEVRSTERIKWPTAEYF